jgi:chemotaxis-related protein WspB
VLFLLFQLGDSRYALDAHEVAVVLPLIDVVSMPGAPPAIAGVCNYRGDPVPVIDLSQVVLGRPAARRLHTRVIVVNYPTAAGETKLLGLIAERATATLRRAGTDFTPSGLSGENLGSVASDARGMTQLVSAQGLLPAPVRKLLFQDGAPS